MPTHEGANIEAGLSILIMNEAGFLRSMSKNGCPPDLVSLDGFRQEIDLYINWHNYKRIKLSLEGLTPIEYRHHLGFNA